MANIYCQKEGKQMDESQFYTYKDGSKMEICKKCLTMHVDNFDESTFLWILEKLDLPYIPEEWNTLRDRAYEKNPEKMTGMSVIGKYISKMKLKQWREFTWADTERFRQEQEQRAEEHAQEIEARNAEAKERLERGEISQAEFLTLTTVEEKRKSEPAHSPVSPIGANNLFDETNFISQDELIDVGAELTQEDKVYLAMKWGRLYQAHEWVQLEKKYQEMVNAFDIQDADTLGTLIHLCKTDLKMNQAIDSGDLDGYQKLSRVYDALRKSCNFTAAQNKAAKEDVVDSIGELIVMCEREGFIPRFATDIPQDKVDFTLRDMKDYTYKLITQDLGFGQQIEAALKKIEIQKQMEEAEAAAAAEGEEDLFSDSFSSIQLTDDDMEEYFEDVAAQKEHDKHLGEDN